FEGVPKEISRGAEGVWKGGVWSSQEVSATRHTLYRAGKPSRDEAERRVRHQRIQDRGYSAIGGDRPIEAEPSRILKSRVEDVLLMQSDKLPPRYDVRP